MRYFFPLFSLSVSCFCLGVGYNSALAQDAEQGQLTSELDEQSTSSSNVKRPKAIFFEETRKIKRQGFKKLFLRDALNGSADPLAGIGGSGTGGFSPEFQGVSNSNEFSSSGAPITGVLTTGGSDFGTPVNFTQTGAITPLITINSFDQRGTGTASITTGGNTITVPIINAGVSGDDGFATVITNVPGLGTFNIRAQDLNGRSPFNATIIPNGLAPDR